MATCKDSICKGDPELMKAGRCQECDIYKAEQSPQTASINGSTTADCYVLSKSRHGELCDYLLCHEHDIATGTNDFDYLFNIFGELIKREPTDT